MALSLSFGNAEIKIESVWNITNKLGKESLQPTHPNLNTGQLEGGIDSGRDTLVPEALGQEYQERDLLGLAQKPHLLA